MVLRKVAGLRKGEDVEDLLTYLRELDGSPPVHEVAALACLQHGDEPATWSYVEADASAGLARRRCLACGASTWLLDSEDRWTHPPMHCCQGCGHSIAEVAAGLSVPDGQDVTWVAVAARCVECGRIAGLTDFVLPGVPVSEVLSRL